MNTESYLGEIEKLRKIVRQSMAQTANLRAVNAPLYIAEAPDFNWREAPQEIKKLESINAQLLAALRKIKDDSESLCRTDYRLRNAAIGNFGKQAAAAIAKAER